MLVAINVGVWLLQVASGVSPAHASSPALIAWGGDLPLYTLTGDTWRLLTAMFLHGGIVHLALNMYVLAFTAPLVEYEFGTGRMLAIYLAGGLLASCASVFWAEMRATPANPVPLLTRQRRRLGRRDGAVRLAAGRRWCCPRRASRTCPSTCSPASTRG